MYVKSNAAKRKPRSFFNPKHGKSAPSGFRERYSKSLQALRRERSKASRNQKY